MKSAYQEIMDIRGKGVPKSGQTRVIGSDPVFSTKFKIGETCAAIMTGIGMAVSDIWELKTGRPQTSVINVRHAAAAMRSSEYMRRTNLNGTLESVIANSHTDMQRITQPWRTKDGRWFLPHFGLPNLRDRVLGVLGCKPNPTSVANAVSNWNAIDLENAIDEARACGAMIRSHTEWMGHPHGQVLAAKPVVEIIKIGESDPEPFPDGDRPLSGIRALDLTRILAGPIAARTLAEHGAEVLMITKNGLPQIHHHVLDTSHGKRSSYLNLKTPEEAANLHKLARTADVFSQGYRPAVMQRLGFGPEELAANRPGIIYVTISCFGADGPFSHRAGWEQIAQTVTGICHEGSPDRPALLPAAACDYTTGYLAAYGVLLALARRAAEGGSYHIRASLCQSGMLIYRQGNVKFNQKNMDLTQTELTELYVKTATQYGSLMHLGPVLKMGETPASWVHPTPTLGGDKPEWLTFPKNSVAAE